MDLIGGEILVEVCRREHFVVGGGRGRGLEWEKDKIKEVVEENYYFRVCVLF